jgi:large subunit ribosomal protein L6
MSKFAKIPVQIPEGVKFDFNNHKITVTGNKGTLERVVPAIVEIENKENNLIVTSKEQSKFGEAIKGTVRSHIVNMIKGVTEGWSTKLEINGTGYRAEVRGDELILTVGYSHPISVKAPEGIKFNVEKNVITVEGSNKETVTQLASNIKKVRLPDAYKGKGIRYLGEELKLKPGKQAAKAAA